MGNMGIDMVDTMAATINEDITVNMDIYMVDTTADTIKESIMGNMGINMEDIMGPPQRKTLREIWI